ncbi:hypothetical protein BESB_073380 [Besnoitia besnoiti]|uniref:Uncharacterized protein n=1 Tax=Besnoitia besnoiti TaxID=94643 RepID=A0A2A9ME09_BESBE|nr:uncharacterized protein BESB_073380 [Besnoitia besnoiti]PFH34186.1 hypothetical protein BESB_073380 [Besnoitia besnoiti]
MQAVMQPSRKVSLRADELEERIGAAGCESVGARTGRSTGRAEQSHLRRRLAAGGANDGRPEDPIATCADLLRGGYEGASEPPSGEEQNPESPSNPVDSEDTPEAPQPKTEEDPPTVQLDAVTDELPGVPGLVDQLEDTKARLKRELQGSYPILETLVIWEIIETQATRLPTLLKEVGLTVSPLEQGLSLVTDPSAVAAAREARIARSKALILSRIKRLYSSCSELPNILRKARLLHHIGGRDEFPEVPEGAISQDTMKEMTDVLKKLLVAGSRSKPMQSGDSHWICGVFF